MGNLSFPLMYGPAKTFFNQAFYKTYVYKTIDYFSP